MLRSLAHGCQRVPLCARWTNQSVSQANTKCNQSFGVQMCVTAASSGRCTVQRTALKLHRQRMAHWIARSLFLHQSPCLTFFRYFRCFGISMISLRYEEMLHHGSECFVHDGHRSRNVHRIFSARLHSAHTHTLAQTRTTDTVLQSWQMALHSINIHKCN